MTNTAGKNAETVRRGYDAFNKADMKTLNELFDDNVSWHTPGRSSVAATARAARRFLPNLHGMAAKPQERSRPSCRRWPRPMTGA